VLVGSVPLQTTWRSQVPFAPRLQTLDMLSPFGQALGAIGGSGPQSLGPQVVFSGVSAAGWLAPQAANKRKPSAVTIEVRVMMRR
jgi:hypothetical protein